ncbi:unnamed protein product, partial [Didymodactylos carnosus]
DKTKRKSLRRDGSYRVFQITRKQKDDDEDNEEEEEYSLKNSNENGDTSIQKKKNFTREKSVKSIDQTNQWKRKNSKNVKSDNIPKKVDNVKENVVEDKFTLEKNNNQTSAAVSHTQIDSILSKIPTDTDDIVDWSTNNTNNGHTEDEILSDLLSRADNLEKNVNKHKDFGAKILPTTRTKRKRKCFISICTVVIGLIIIIVMIIVVVLAITRKISYRDQNILPTNTTMFQNT